MTDLLHSKINTLTKTQRWTIENFSLFPSNVGDFTDSTPFDFADCKWSLSLSPGGNCSKYEGYVGVFLRLLNPKPNVESVTVAYEMCLVKPCGECGPLYKSSQPGIFALEDDEERGPRWGTFTVIRREDLLDETKGFLLNDTVTVQVKMTVVLDAKHTSIASQKSASCEKNVARSNRQLLESGLHSDISLNVQGTEILAHKAILAARSPVFKVMFSHKMRESLEGKVEIDDHIPLPVFRELLRFLESRITAF